MPTYSIRPSVTAEDRRTLLQLTRLSEFQPDSFLTSDDDGVRAEVAEIVIDWAERNTPPSMRAPIENGTERDRLNLRVSRDYLSNYSLVQVATLMHNGLRRWRMSYRSPEIRFSDYRDEPYVSDAYRRMVLTEAFRRAADPRAIRLEWGKQDLDLAAHRLREIQKWGSVGKVGFAVDREFERREAEVEALADTVGIPMWVAVMSARIELGQRRNGHLPWQLAPTESPATMGAVA